MLSKYAVLVVEAEFLIALDIQRVLEQSHAARVVFARSAEEASALEGRFSEFDLAIVELPADPGATLPLIHALCAAGVAVVATSSNWLTASADLEMRRIPLVPKPFLDADLLTAATIALATVDPADPTDQPPTSSAD